MGAKKKKAMPKLGNSQTPRMPNSSITAKNVRPKDLKGVIFGCTHSTIQECHSKQLFGLPAGHFAYVRNIYPGMALFLFNYSDRKLHGIFEATSTGQMRINPCAWTSDGSEPTQYPAQVRVEYRTHCQPLTEEQFKPIIGKNYYIERHFWFELDHKQTTALLALFSSMPLTGSPFSHHMMKKNHPVKNLHTHESGSCSNSQAGPNFHDFANKNRPSGTESNEDAGKYYQEVVTSCWAQSFASVVSKTVPLVQEAKVDGFEAQCKAQVGLSRQNSSTSASIWDELSVVGDGSLSWDISNWEESECNAHKKDVMVCRKEHKSDTEITDSCNAGSLEWERLPIALSVEDDRRCETYRAETTGYLTRPIVLGKDHTQMTAVTEEAASEVSYLSTRQRKSLHAGSMKNLAEELSSFVGTNSEMHSPNPNFVLSQVVKELENLKVTHILQTRKVSSLEHELAESKAEVRQLRQKCKMLESASDFTDASTVELKYPLTSGVVVDHNESVFLVGGCDGSSWLSSLDLYLPSCDTLKSLKPMKTVRSHASVTKLNGNLYVLGGVDSETTTYYDSVASYNPLRDQWSVCPSLKRRKGNLASTSFYGKIFAIGGGNENECFSEVEMFDENAGIWIQTRSMKSKRFAPAAAEINGAIYVVGGYDGDSYLKSAERFDYREHSWTRLKNMRTVRGCHSLSVLNEKIYALGGYDGTQMVPTVEVFDPRNGKWMIVEEMNVARGYAGAATLGQSIYVMGGMKDYGEILNTVECYKEGRGWQKTRSKAMGNRCFFSAIVL
uniref:DCD domain-containing protein n=1 Tax=Kalanchoe fedtschenkoi TaxID=63787 RepID=A0A7N0TC99_KALFE